LKESSKGISATVYYDCKKFSADLVEDMREDRNKLLINLTKENSG
jgi:hypothetical protein